MAKEPTTPITDVKSPDKVKPTATARPIVVNDRSMLAADPMMAPAANDEETIDPGITPEPASAPTVSRQAKPIEPMHTDLAPEAPKQPAEAAENADAIPSTAPESPQATNQPEEPQEAPASKKVEITEASSHSEVEVKKGQAQPTEPSGDDAPAKPAEEAQPAPAPEPAAEEAPETRDTEAQNAAAENAQTAEEAEEIVRQEHMEELISSGKYAVPINAIQRKRSRMFVIVMTILAVLLALAVLDLLLDIHFVVWPTKVPHTHLFSAP